MVDCSVVSLTARVLGWPWVWRALLVLGRGRTSEQWLLACPRGFGSPEYRLLAGRRGFGSPEHRFWAGPRWARFHRCGTLPAIRRAPSHLTEPIAARWSFGLGLGWVGFGGGASVVGHDAILGPESAPSPVGFSSVARFGSRSLWSVLSLALRGRPVLGLALLAVLACSEPPSVWGRRCPDLPGQMKEGEVVRVKVAYRDVPNALNSITASVAQAGGFAEYELFDGWFAVEIDKTTANVLCGHGLVQNVVEDLPAVAH